MPLPQQVINQLSQDPGETPSWLGGVLFFSGGFLIIALGFYFGLLFIYQPYLNNNLQAAQNKVATVDQSITSGDQANLVAFYSEVVNVQSLLETHVVFSQLLSWLERNTEANVYYSQFSFSSGNQIALTGYAASEADISQQVAIFESSPAVEKVLIPSIGSSNTNGLLTFSATLVLDPSIMMATTTTP